MQTRFSQFVFTSWRFPAIGILAFISLAPVASAAAVGFLTEANCSGGGASVTTDTITWLPAGTVSGTGCIDTGAGTDVTYLGGTLLPGDTGNIMNLVAGGAAVDQFMTFEGTTLDFVLDGFETDFTTTYGTNCAAASAVPGATCVVFTNSPFLLTNLGVGGSGVSVTAFGTVTDGVAVTDWSGSFTTQLSIDVGTIQTDELAGGTVTGTQSGQFTVTYTPEPASWSMIAAGLIILPIVAWRRRAARV